MKLNSIRLDCKMAHLTIDELEKKNEELQSELNLMKQQNIELNTKLEWFMEQFRLAQLKRFGSSSEKSIDIDNQISLFNEAEAEYKPDAPEPTYEEITYKRKKEEGHREKMLEDLPVETIEYTLPEEEQFCNVCDKKLHVMSVVVKKEIIIEPPKLKVVEHVRYVYGCRNCENNGIKASIKTASMPNPVIPNSIASSSAVAYVMCDKFVKGLPLYRQEQDWDRLGVSMSRQTMANWMIYCSERWLKFIYDRMREHLLKRDILHADETTLQVLHEPGRPATSTSYMWLFRTGRDGPHIILYNYQTSRSGKHPRNFLEGFTGYLSSDGYAGYNDMPGIINVGCFAHARRNFADALKAMPPKKDDKITTTEEGLAFCNNLYSIEKTLEDATPEERYSVRMEKSRPILDDFKAWIKYQASRVMPKSALGKAIIYCKNQMNKLESYLLDGRLEIDNNRAERSIKPFVMGRKAWLFSNTPKGANSSAVIYSVVESAKENGLNPFPYLTHLLGTLPNINLEDKSTLDDLMPWSNKLPEECRLNKN